MVLKASSASCSFQTMTTMTRRPIQTAASDIFSRKPMFGYAAMVGATVSIAFISMGVWEYFSPGGAPRVGVLRFETTRGDRLFISLLGSAFIHIAWLGLTDLNLWWAVGLSLIYTVLVFRYV